MERGTLVLVVGPSGVGKDTLIDYCRSRLAGVDAVVFPQRAITRPADSGGEVHEPVSEEEFERRDAGGGFMLSWRAHGHCYGIPASIEADLHAGRTVVVNVSRAIVEEARRRYQPLRIVSVFANRETLAARLGKRGREDGDDIARRLARADSTEIVGSDVIPIDNSGSIEDAGEVFLRFLAG